MNYEDKYNKTIEAIKRIYDQADSFGKELMEKEFPELSESEDERIKRAAIEFVRQNKSFNYCLGVGKEDVVAWLEKQGEQKPAEWSKKDNEMLNNVIQRIKDLDHYWNKPTDEKMIDWLKSLKPNHWKPSEFQLECLNKVIPHNNTEKDCELEDVLTELYNDLKNL